MPLASLIKFKMNYYLGQLELVALVSGALRAYLRCKSVMVVATACLPSPPDRWQPLGKVFLVASTKKIHDQPCALRMAISWCHAMVCVHDATHGLQLVLWPPWHQTLQS